MSSSDHQTVPPVPPWAGRYSQPVNRRRFAVGDVHGCPKTLRALVEEKLCLEKDDCLYLLGDYIDRGPDSKGVLDYLLQLWEADYDIRPLMGNHEEMLLEAASGDRDACRLWNSNGGWDTLQQFGVATPADIPRRYLDFLTMLPRVRSTDDYIFVHAGLNFRTTDPMNDTSPYDLLWIRDCRLGLEKLGGRTLITGHTMTPLFTIRDSLNSQCICLDNGCYSKGEMGYGNLVALDLDTRELQVQDNCS